MPRLPVLDRNEAVVVEIGLAIPEAACEPLHSILGDDERRRAARFVFPSHRRRYLTAHAALRLVLAHYVEEDPRSLQFERSTYGKPRLVHRLAGDYEINLSHSDDHGLIAVARAREVGVDIEVHRADIDIYALARYVLSPAEQRAFAAVPVADQRAAFFRAWARKESFVKAIGEGLACPLDSFDVSLDEQTDTALLDCRHVSARSARWTTIPLNVGMHAGAALTACGKLSLQYRAESVWKFA